MKLFNKQPSDTDNLILIERESSQLQSRLHTVFLTLNTEKKDSLDFKSLQDELNRITKQKELLEKKTNTLKDMIAEKLKVAINKSKDPEVRISLNTKSEEQISVPDSPVSNPTYVPYLVYHPGSGFDSPVSDSSRSQSASESPSDTDTDSEYLSYHPAPKLEDKKEQERIKLEVMKNEALKFIRVVEVGIQAKLDELFKNLANLPTPADIDIKKLLEVKQRNLNDLIDLAQHIKDFQNSSELINFDYKGLARHLRSNIIYEIDQVKSQLQQIHLRDEIVAAASVSDVALRTLLRNIAEAKVHFDKMDIAYDVLCHCNELLATKPDDSQAIQVKQNAILLLQNVLLIQDSSEIDTEKLIHSLMQERLKMKSIYPDYFPGSKRFGLISFAAISDSDSAAVLKIKAKAASLLTGEGRSSIFVHLHPLWKVKDQEIKAQRLSKAELEDLRVVVHNGKLYKPFGSKLTTMEADTTGFYSHNKPDYAAFVIHAESDDELYLFDHNELDDKRFHSSLMGGDQGFFAGEIKINNGKLEVITNYSGHFKPSPEQLFNVLKAFKKKGIDISETTVRLIQPDGQYIDESANDFFSKHVQKQAQQQLANTLHTHILRDLSSLLSIVDPKSDVFQALKDLRQQVDSVKLGDSTASRALINIRIGLEKIEQQYEDPLLMAKINKVKEDLQLMSSRLEKCKVDLGRLCPPSHGMSLI